MYKKNHETQSSINQILNDEIGKKNQLYKRIKKKQHLEENKL
jgi:hypothetical protein